MSLLELIRSDLSRYAETYRQRGQTYSRWRVALESLLFKPGFQAVLLYRISHALYRRGWNYLPWSITRLSQALTGAEIEFNASVGPGLLLPHPCGIVIGRWTTLGRRTTIYQGVTFGARSWRQDEIGLFPQVGDDCFFFAGCAVLGGVKVGDRCVVAAGAVVVNNLAAGSLAVGVPATEKPERGDEMLRDWGMGGE